MFMNLTIHDTKGFTIQKISSLIHYLYLDSTTMVGTTPKKIPNIFFCCRYSQNSKLSTITNRSNEDTCAPSSMGKSTTFLHTTTSTTR